MPRALQDVMEDAGAFGRYQVLQLVMMMISMLVGAVNILSFIITNIRPIEECSRFANESEWFAATVKVTNGSDDCSLLLAKREVCPDWRYSELTMEESTTSRFGKNCTSIVVIRVSVTFCMIGFLIGSVFYGWVADRYGRMKTLGLTSVHCLLSTLLTAFTVLEALFILSRFLTGIGAAGMVTVSLTYMTESVLPRHRGYVGILLNLSWSLSLLFLTILGYLLRRSSHVELTIGLTCLIPLITSVVIRESPGWLLTRGKANEAVLVLRLVARMNRRRIPSLVSSSLTVPSDIQKVNILAVLRPPGVRSVTLFLWYGFFVVSLVYYGVSVSLQTLKGWDVFSSVALSAGIEFVGVLSFVPLVDCTDRRRLLMAGFCCISVLCAVASVVSVNSDFSLNIVCLLARPVTAVVFSGTILYSVEVFPTSLRTLGLGMCNAVARLSAMIAPFIHFMDGAWPALPFVVYAVTSVGAAVLFLLLPETRRRPIPETIEDAENLAGDYECKRCFR